jgi:hypothetical protein
MRAVSQGWHSQILFMIQVNKSNNKKNPCLPFYLEQAWQAGSLGLPAVRRKNNRKGYYENTIIGCVFLFIVRSIIYFIELQ